MSSPKSSIFGTKRNNAIFFKHDIQNSNVSFMALLNFSPSFFLNRKSIDLEFHERRETIQSLEKFLLFLFKVKLKCFDFSTGYQKLISLILLQLVDHRLIVKDQLFDLDVFFFIVNMPLRNSELLFYHR